MSVQSIPEGYHSVTPYLSIRNANKALAFYQKAFNAELLLVLNTPDGGIAHAEIKIGNSPIMLSEECDEVGNKSPESLGGSAVSLMIYVEDADMTYAQAINAGAIEMSAVTDQFYGDRSGRLKDPFGHTWIISTHIEDLTMDEINTRMKALMENGE